jgi:hypothetical protein
VVSFGLERGSLNALLSDQKPYDQTNPPESLAKITGGEVLIERPASGGVTLNFRADPDPPHTTSGRLTYAFNRAQRSEDVSLENLDLAYDTPRIARALRSQQGLRTPEWIRTPSRRTPLTAPLLWAFLPLEDGWAQLPVFNLTEQIYLDSQVARQALSAGTPPPATLQGAVAFGNRPERLASGAIEHLDTDA